MSSQTIKFNLYADQAAADAADAIYAEACKVAQATYERTMAANLAATLIAERRAAHSARCDAVNAAHAALIAALVAAGPVEPW